MAQLSDDCFAFGGALLTVDAALALIAAVLGQGRILWWTEAAWLGWALVLAIPMFAAALVIEHGRANPLLNTRWLGSADIVRFTIVTLMARVVLSEQTYAAVGLLNVLGQNNDQLRTLFTIILLGEGVLAAVMGVQRAVTEAGVSTSLSSM